jgi:hypothetical protein
MMVPARAKQAGGGSVCQKTFAPGVSFPDVRGGNRYCAPAPATGKAVQSFESCIGVCWQGDCVAGGHLWRWPLRTSGNYDDWTIDRWRIEPRLKALDLEMTDVEEKSPALWKDLTLAALIAILLWMAAAAF